MRAPSKPLRQDPAAITKRRQDAGLTKYRLAKILDCSRSLITEIEGGTRSASDALLARMAALFDCEAAQLQASPAAPPADVDVQLRDTERSGGAHDVPELRGW